MAQPAIIELHLENGRQNGCGGACLTSKWPEVCSFELLMTEMYLVRTLNKCSDTI